MNAFKTFKSLDPRDQRNLLILFITALVYWISITTLLPTLPAYIEDIGGNTQQVGIVMGAFAIGLLLSRAWLGKLADRRSRKIVILIGTIVAAIAPLGYLAVHSISHLLIIRAFHGVSVAAFTTGYSALVVDLSPVKQRGEVIGYMSLAVPIGMALGPALGGFLPGFGGYSSLFLTSASCGLVACFLANQVRENRQEYLITQTSLNPSRDSHGSFRQILINPRFLIPTLVFLLVGLVFGTLVTFLPLYIRDIKLEFNAGLFYTIAAIASFAARVFAGKASDHYGRGIFITGSLVCYSGSMLILSRGQTSHDFIVAALLEGTGGGILIPMIMTLIADRSYVNERGRVLAICTAGFDLGIALAGPCLGFLNVSIGYRGMFAVASSFAFLALLLFLSQSNKKLSPSLRFALGKEKDYYALD